MSTAKVLRVRDKILKRGWQLTELYNDVQEAYVTRISGLIADVGGEARLWNLQKALDVKELSGLATAADVWVRHFEKMIVEAEQYLAAAAAKVERGEYIHDDRAETALENAGRPSGNDQGGGNRGSGILDARGNPIS